MSPVRVRRLVSLPARTLLAVVATVSAFLAIWHGGHAVLSLSGIADLPTDQTRTVIGVVATAVASSVVPGWLTVRAYVGPDDGAGD
jgi:hypothetical protein